MAGRIRREDVETVREQTRIDEVVGEYVTLTSAGTGAMKGLCPFHDERSPSFNVRPHIGRYHCFGCGEGGDVFEFLMKVDQLSFSEAIERLAAKAGVTLRYEQGSPTDVRENNMRRRILDANAAAETFFQAQLLTPEAHVGREFLAERGFGREVAVTYGIGFAPAGWDVMVQHLRGRGFRDDELTAAGLVSQGRQGVIDRFRGRLIWPIRDLAGATVGFGARRLSEDDNGPKYLNTSETAVYKKSSVLYGIDLAKRDIAKQRQIVVVEGYTDVMAMHLSGVPTAVATCGTAFGANHIKVVRRLIMDDESRSGEVIFTFDGDEAGRKAALRAFEDDQRFVAQTFVAVEPNGMDPCDLRLARGGEAVQKLVATKEPLFEFAIRSTLDGFDLERAEARVQALRVSAPVVAQIRDPALRPQYSRWLAGQLGMDVEQVSAAVASALRTPRAERTGEARRSQARPGESEPAQAAAPEVALPRPDARDPVVRGEQQLIQLLLQFPEKVDADAYAELGPAAMTTPAFALIDDAVRGLGGPGQAGQNWVARVSENVISAARPLVNELAVASLPERRPGHLGSLAEALLRDTRARRLKRERAEAYSTLQRAEASGDIAARDAASAELMRLQQAEHRLRGE